MTKSAFASFYPMRVVLRLNRATKMGHHPAATICQLLKTAAGRLGHKAFPSNVIPDPIEVGRMSIAKDALYAFGLNLWHCSEEQARSDFIGLIEAIGEIGNETSGKHRKQGLGGNFRIDHHHSLVAEESTAPVAIPEHWIDLQEHNARSQSRLTLRWLTPLCASLPKRFGKNGRKPGFFDNKRFPIHDLANRLVTRLDQTIGVDLNGLKQVHNSDIHLLDKPGLSRLHWIKWLYGEQIAQITASSLPVAEQQTAAVSQGADTGNHINSNRYRSRPKHQTSSNHKWKKTNQLKGQLYGVIGRVQVEVRCPKLLRALVLGQYSNVGEGTNYGLGRYVIEETQQCLTVRIPPFLRAQRSVSQSELAFEHPIFEQECHRLNVSTSQARQQAQTVVDGTFEARPVERFLLPGEKTRLISVPARSERVLQKAIYEQLNPTLDRFLSDSCIAYRKGLSRKNAAQKIEQAFTQGWRWALKADFHHFFDSIDHRILRDKLEAYIQDDDIVELLMKWVVSGAPQPGRGLPTGAVISPLLANLFLQSFDEAVKQDGGRLVRYGDDFVILFRDPQKGRSVLQRANSLAQQLMLHLNDEKTKLLDLEKTPFDYLGYRFFCEKGWQYRGDGLKQVEDLGWHQAPKTRDVSSAKKLPGEQGIEQRRAGSWIVGPNIDWIGIEGKDVVCRSRSQGSENRFQHRRVSELIVLGPVTIDQSLFRKNSDIELQLIVADDIGRWNCLLTDSPPVELPQLVTAQVQFAADSARCLEISRRLIAAKLNNFATLAEQYPIPGKSNSLASHLRDLAGRAKEADDSESLLGFEGAGAAAWYKELDQRIGQKFHFERRVHPNASDPVNVMLNIAHSLLHRVIALCLVREGFAPSIGVLHQPGRRHAALASDLQEVFRHLMERVVIDVTHTISPGEFHETSSGPFELRIEPGAYRTLVASVFKMLSTTCIMKSQQAAKPYRRHIATITRSLHRHLLNSEAPFKIFEHIN